MSQRQCRCRVIDRLTQSIGIDRLEDVIERVHLERSDGVPIVGRDENHQRHRIDADLLYDFERARPTELDVEEHDVGLSIANGRHGLPAATALSDACHARELRELPAKPTAGDRLVIDNEDLHRGISLNGIRISTRVPCDSAVPLGVSNRTDAAVP